jgi:glycosyltransferase involved in cell wall biosynthesis
MKHNKIRVGVIGLRGFPHVMGGVERHCEQLYPRLGKLGYKIFLCRRSNYLSRNSRGQTYENITFLDIWTLRQKHFEAFFHSLFCVILLKFHHIKILHVHSIGPGLVAPIARLLGFKIVLTYHLPNYMQGKWSVLDKKILKIAETIACRFSNEIIAVSKNNQHIIKINTGRESTFIPNGVQVTQGPFINIDEWGLKNQNYIFTACRFVPEKGLDILLQAYQMINTDWKLVIAGGADHESDYSRNLDTLGKKNPDVIFTGVLTGIKLESLFHYAG